MRNVLMVSYFFPPLGGIGVQRSLKFARYLPACGWRPLVLTVAESPYVVRDPELLAEVPAEAVVFRTRSVEAEHLYELLNRPSAGREAPKPVPTAPRHAIETPTPSMAGRLYAWLFVPDGRIGWLPFARAKGNHILKAEQVHAIFSTSAPYTAHMVARALAMRSGLGWVMDMRDPWVDNHFAHYPTRVHRALHAHFERRCVTRADRIVTVSPLMTEGLQRRYGDLPGDRFATIPNGFDRADFDPTLTPDPARFVLRHVGSLYAGQCALPFLRGLAMATQRQPELKLDLSVEFLGVMDRANSAAWRSAIETYDLADWVVARPFVTHHQAVQLMQRSQVLVLILGGGLDVARVYPGKVFEYLGAGRPILAVVPPGVCADLVKGHNAGLVAAPDDPGCIADAILALYDQFKGGTLSSSASADIDEYDRRNLTGRLAGLLDEVYLERSQT